MINIFSIILLTVLFTGFLKYRNEDNKIVDFVISIFIFVTLLTNVGYFIKIGNITIEYIDFMEIVLMFTLMLKVKPVKLKYGIRVVGMIFVFSIIIGELLVIVFKPQDVLVMKNITNWDLQLLGLSDYFTYPNFDFVNFQKLIRILMFVIVIIKLAQYLNYNRNFNFKRVLIALSYIFVISGSVDFISKYIIHKPLIENFNTIFFGTDGAQLTDIIYRNGNVGLVGFFREPSHFAIIGGFPLMIFFMFQKHKDMKSNILEIAIVLLIFISGSFSAFGLVLYWIVVKCYTYVLKKNKSYLSIGVLFISLPIILSILVLIINKSSYWQYYIGRLNNLISIDQLTYSSELSRIKSINASFAIFTKHFLFGIGLGNTTAHAFIPSMLANVGVVGSILYLLFVKNFFLNVCNSNLIEFYTLLPLWLIVGDIGLLYDVNIIVLLLILVFVKNEYYLNYF